MAIIMKNIEYDEQLKKWRELLWWCIMMMMTNEEMTNIEILIILNDQNDINILFYYDDIVSILY